MASSARAPTAGTSGARGERATPRLRWPPRLWLGLLVFALSTVPFAPALSQGFVALDDDYNFLHNEAYRGFGREQLAWMFTASHLGHYQPLSWLTLALDYRLWGLDGAGYHATNLLFHGLGMLALYGLARAVLGTLFAGLSDARLSLAAAGAALFHGMHPLRVESVAWATERRDVQSGLFLLLAVWAYVARARAPAGPGGGRGRLLAVSLACYVVSLFSKAWGITLPAMLLVLDHWPLGRRARGEPLAKLVLEKWVYALPAAVVAALALWAQGEAGARERLADHTLLERCVQACYGLCFYVRKTLVPRDLAALYWLEMELDPLEPVHAASCAAVLAGGAALVGLRRRLPGTAAAFAVYAISISPVLGFVQSGFQKVADRYSYLACVPFALLFGAGLARAFGSQRWRPFAALGAPAVLALLGTLAWRQTLVWRDSETLYERVVAVEPDNYFGWHNLAVQYQLQGRFDEALEAERRSVEHHPGRGNLPARVNLAHLLERRGSAEEARSAWRAILELDPTQLEALRALVRDELRAGDAQAAEALIEASLARAPEFVDGWAELAGLWLRRGEPERAVAVWERAVRAAPASPRALHGLGAALLALDRDQEAGQWLEQAFHLDNRDVEIAVDFARVLGRTGHADVAEGLLAQVLAARPGHPRAVAAERALAAGARP